jgi:hypothetical protein
MISVCMKKFCITPEFGVSEKLGVAIAGSRKLWISAFSRAGIFFRKAREFLIRC